MLEIPGLDCSGSDTLSESGGITDSELTGSLTSLVIETIFDVVGGCTGDVLKGAGFELSVLLVSTRGVL